MGIDNYNKSTPNPALLCRTGAMSMPFDYYQGAWDDQSYTILDAKNLNIDDGEQGPHFIV